MQFYKKCVAKSYSILLTDTNLASDNPLRFRKNLLESIQKLIMTIDYNRDEKLQYNINREAAKISVLSSAKIDKYEYFAGEEILHSGQSRMIKPAKFTYSALVKALENKYKQLKTKEKNKLNL